MLLIEPWDKALINAIVKAIGASDLGITPNSDGTVVRLPFPAPTEERRRELVKECREYAEQAKVSIRNIRRDSTTSSSAMRSSPRTMSVASRPRSRSTPMSMSPRSRSF